MTGFVAGVELTDSEVITRISGATWTTLLSADMDNALYDAGAQQVNQLYGQLNKWNMRAGVFWREREPFPATVAGSFDSADLLRVDPTASRDNVGTDNEQPVRRTVTGALSVRGRVFPRQDDFRLYASAGAPQVNEAEVVMRFSDDNGNSWTQTPPITLQAGAWNQELVWRSLGAVRSPLRIFEITDIRGLVRIGDAQARVEGEGDE